MSISNLAEQLSNCDNHAKKIRLSSCNQTNQEKPGFLKCMDVLKVLRAGDTAHDGTPGRCRHGRTALRNRTNLDESKHSLQTSETKIDKLYRDASNPGTVKEMLARVPEIEKLFTVKRRIGYGTFSSVFLATSNHIDVEEAKKNYALKHIYSSSTSAKRILFETKCLREIGRCNNVVGLERIVNNGSEHVLVMPYYKHDRFSVLIKNLSFNEVREYMKNLLLALRRVHKFNVIHRDVKPSNFLYDSVTKRCALIDFGLAQNAHYYLPSRKPSIPSHPKAACRSPRALSTGDLATTPKGLATRSVHNRNSMMVAMAITKKKAESRKRLQDCASDMETDSPTPIKYRKLTGADPGLVSPEGALKINYTGTPRPAALPRRGLGVLRPPIFKTAPSPLSASSEVALTSPLGGGSTGGHLPARTIGDVFPEVKRKLKGMSLASNENGHQRLGKCRICLANKKMVPRAGTSGFRAPEVLIQCPHQTTAIDVWSVGVMFLSLLSGRYPFFKPVDDLESLAQLVALFGTDKLKQVARTCGKKLSAPYYCAGHEIRSVVDHFRLEAVRQSENEGFAKPAAAVNAQRDQSDVSNPQSSKPTRKPAASQLYSHRYPTEEIPDSAYHLLGRLLDVDPLTRITAKDALGHPFFADF